MKHLSLLFCVTLFAVAAPAPSAHAQAAVNIDFFFDTLDPYGSWIYTPNYGYVWEPAVARRHRDWAPYSDGYWAYTDAGWTWISNEDFGWATYHYGRWIRMHDRWMWVPGYEWAPAWVSWRQSDNFIGWAPLPPEARWSANIGFRSWTDSYYDIGPSYYNFVPVGSFATRSSLQPVIVDRSRNVTFVDNSVNITNITRQQNVVNNIFVGGPDPARVERRSGNPVRRLTLRHDTEGFRNKWLEHRGDRPRDFSSLSRIERDQLIVAAPDVRRENAPSLPPRVKEKFDRPDVDRGWRGLGDSDLAERIRDRHKQEMAKAKDEKMPDKEPVLATSDKPPPAIGRELKPEERKIVPKPDPSRVEEEVRKAERPTTSPPNVTDSPPQPSDDPRRPGVAAGENRPKPETADPSKPGNARPQEPPGRAAVREPSDDNDRKRGPDRPGRTQPPDEQRPPMPKPPEMTPPRNSIDVRPGRGRDDFRRGGQQVPPNTSPEQPRVPPVPMPDPRKELQKRTAPIPRPEAPQVRPAPMPQPVQPPQGRPDPRQQRPEAGPSPAERAGKPPSPPQLPGFVHPKPQGGPPGGGRHGPPGKKQD
ncbi:MAG: hypothetical protein IAE77_26745 [Prosthecobacter sp.]|jgi:hypothetical protein|uniref:DUF6600 domain-containing protein n=1 Tax=Prosthecobacter sp. TaxID=1965333 RepID=UPI0019F9EC1A|nr:DUF6600 domain-containing protein [Prosthecobacter sp.]MBE2287084.1 hypothetical protein [Prosthecobacter sp.]